MIGTRLADRYELLEEGPRALGGRLFRARDLAFSEIVAVKMIGSGKPEEAGTAEVQAEIRKLQDHTHPALLRYQGIEPGEGFLVREWIHGFSLLELLKRRHELTASETLHLLAPLASALDFIAGQSLPLPRQLLAKLLVEFEPATATDKIARSPMGDWPPFALKLNPLSLRSLLLDADGQTTMTTITDLRTLIPETRLNAPLRFAELLYEVLGGHVRTGRDRRYTPLPALREEGNGVLRRAQLESRYADCRSLWADLEIAEPSDLRARTPLARPSADGSRTLRIPAPLLAPPESAAVIKLVPADRATPAIHLIARSTFTLGRSFAHADFITRFHPETPTNDDLTNQISRIHVTAEAKDGRIWLRDGHGDAASVNGTQLGEKPLPSSPPTPLEGRVQISLGGVFSVEITPLLTSLPTPLRIENLPASDAPDLLPRELNGAVFFLPAHGHSPVRHAAWLFSEAGFSLDPEQRIVWDTRGSARSPAAFHYLQGAFWLSNRSLPDEALRIADTPLMSDQIAPLINGRILQIGPARFTIELS